MKRIFVFFLLVGTTYQSAQAQSNTRDGAALGGVAGAVIGGIIGHQNNETPEGALIGGAVGAIAGGLIGNNKDKQIATERYYQEQLGYQRQQLNETVRRAVSVPDVVTMCRSGLSDAVIVNHIQTNGVQRRIEVSDILALHQQGVSEVVITAMQQAPLTSSFYSTTPARPTVVARPQPPAVIVQEAYPVVAPVYVPRPVYYAPPPGIYFHYSSGGHHHHRHGF